MEIKIGDEISGKVVKITNYGAFVEIDGGKWGLIHISKLADKYVKNVEDYVKQGEEVRVKVIGIDENGKVSLSLISPKKDGPFEEKREEQIEEVKPVNFEDKLDRFLKDSEDKISKIRNARIRKTRGKR